ncbi:shikimate dehydrogenase [Thalassotalea sediminis]|uniref:shikimate dehydrogenase n=1 Tax=Thalassotalea sediminis TaxID=1759089 RepID=UPI002573412D|nr:shikimate dehydrogenase [Thalassotalea sediminis]
MDKYAVFGNPISQSKSPLIHQAFAKQTAQAIEYTAIKAELDNFSGAIRDFMAHGGKGCNVTVPFKEQAFQLADQVSERAELAGAVNTLSFKEDGSIFADNTDGAGLVEDLKAHGAPLSGRILLIGAGGAARGVIHPLLAFSPLELVIVNRTFYKAESLAKRFESFGNVVAMTTEDLKEAGTFDLVINSTSASLSGDLPPISSHVFNQNSVAYDMVYGDKPTVFCRWAKEQGCKIAIDGLGMLLGQAAVAFSIWRNVMPNTQVVMQMLRSEMSK